MTNIYLNGNSSKVYQPFIQRDIKDHSPYAYNQDSPEQSDYYNYLPPEVKRKKKVRATLQTMGIVGAIGVLVFSLRKVNVVSKKLREFAVSAESTYSNSGTFHKVATKVASGFDRVSKILTNINPIKDYSLHKLLEKSKFTREIRDDISKYFSDKNKEIALDSLKTTRDSYGELISSIDSAILNSKKKGNNSVKNFRKFYELQEVMEESRRTPTVLLESTFDDFYKQMKGDMRYLENEMDMTRLFSTESLQGFVPEDILEQRRFDYADKLFRGKNKISFTFTDKIKYSKEKILDMNTIIYSISDKDAEKSMRKAAMAFDNSLKKYFMDSRKKEKRESALIMMRQSVLELRAKVNLLPEGANKVKLVAHCNDFGKLFDTSNPGLVQRLRMLVGEVWGDGSPTDLHIKRKADLHSRDINEAYESMVNMFDKERDIALGSGAGDILGVTLPFVFYAWEMKKDDTTDKRVGTTLELGIPMVGGALFYLHTLKSQYSGFKALSLTAGISAVMNLAGSIAFKKYKAYRAEQLNNTDNSNKVQG